jgi:tetratricopeptide (TPR) repeat protein
MNSLQPPDSHYLSAASGWLGLGRYIEANEELEKISPENLAHPDVMEVLWHIYAKAGNWQICLDIASAILKLDPRRPFGWTHRSFALYELKRTQEAFDLLVPMAQEFPNVWRIPYSLALYCAQLGRFIECQLWLQKALAVDRETVKRTAIVDPNLKPLWVTLSGKNVMKNLIGEAGPFVQIPYTSQATFPTMLSKRLS